MSEPKANIVVVGLGPADQRLITTETRALLDRAHAEGRCVLRTSRHPASAVVPQAESFDHFYESSASFGEVYRAIVGDLIERAERSPKTIVYAVPGSPNVAESTVELLLKDDRVWVEVLPALSFADLAWTRLGIDPLAQGVRIVDGRNFAIDAAGERGPLLVAQCDRPHVLSDIKLSIENPGSLEVTVIQRLGLDDERMFRVPWNELDRAVDPDHLTSLYLPRMAVPVAAELARFGWLVERLRQDCPWDNAQTHESLRRHLLEETYEVLEAIDGFDGSTGDGSEELCEELGDLLFQVFIHSELARESGHFTIVDVAAGIYNKLYDRHPHVFGDGETAAVTADEALASWEQSKKVEKQRDSVMDGIPPDLPALLFASKIQSKAASTGRPLSLASPVELADGSTEGDVGDALFRMVDEARALGIDPEQALRLAARRAEASFRRTE